MANYGKIKSAIKEKGKKNWLIWKLIRIQKKEPQLNGVIM
jgi:hypothetical protein